ncbi:MAG: four helix bundle protein [Planctomycetes bacterium]|nr:four helix bundle protein [Planctomycetota bacterium]
MATFSRFEDIEAWQKTRGLVSSIYAATRQDVFSRDFGLRDQIRRAAVSVLSNIAEGFERDGNKEFIQFLAIAKGSLGEIKSQLCVAMDQQYIQKAEFDHLYKTAGEISRMIAGLITYLRRTPIRGPKYKHPNK